MDDKLEKIAKVGISLSEDEIIQMMKEPHKCPYTNCCSYLEYDQCNNHSHILCTGFEEWYRK